MRQYVSLLTSSPFTSPRSPWIPAWLAPFLSKHCPLSSPLRHKNTRRWWLFCFWILVNIFILTPAGGPWVTTHDEELLKIFVLVWYLFTLQEEVGEGRGGWVPFLKFTWTRVQTAWRGRATLRVSQPPRPLPADLVYRYCRNSFEDKVVPTHSYTIFLWHILGKHIWCCVPLQAVHGILQLLWNFIDSA